MNVSGSVSGFWLNPQLLQAVKAMQFEGEDAKKKLASIESNRERALLDEELAQQLLDDDEDDDDYI